MVEVDGVRETSTGTDGPDWGFGLPRMGLGFSLLVSLQLSVVQGSCTPSLNFYSTRSPVPPPPKPETREGGEQI